VDICPELMERRIAKIYKLQPKKHSRTYPSESLGCRLLLQPDLVSLILLLKLALNLGGAFCFLAFPYSTGKLAVHSLGLLVVASCLRLVMLPLTTRCAWERTRLERKYSNHSFYANLLVWELK